MTLWLAVYGVIMAIRLGDMPSRIAQPTRDPETRFKAVCVFDEGFLWLANIIVLEL